MSTESCKLPRPENADALPCAWPDCPEGSPKERVALMEGSVGVLRMHAGRRYEVEADQGATLWERKRVGSNWEWTKVDGRSGG